MRLIHVMKKRFTAQKDTKEHSININFRLRELAISNLV